MSTVFAYLNNMAQVNALVKMGRLTVWGEQVFFMKETSAHTRQTSRVVRLTGSPQAPQPRTRYKYKVLALVMQPRLLTISMTIHPLTGEDNYL